MVTLVRCLRRETWSAGWIAPLWGLALVGLLFIPVDYRGGADIPHSHALLQLLLDAQDGHLLHTHAHAGASVDQSYDWLDPAVTDPTTTFGQGGTDVGQQREGAPAVSVISFLVVIPLPILVSVALPRIVPVAHRLRGLSSTVHSPPPRVAAIAC